MSDDDSKVPLPDLEASGEMQTIDDAGALAPAESQTVDRGAAGLEALFDVPVPAPAGARPARLSGGGPWERGPGPGPQPSVEGRVAAYAALR